MISRARTNMDIRSRGFTVLEVLVATAMFSILIAALYTVFNSAIRLRERTYEIVEHAVPTDFIIARIKHDLDHVMPPTGLMAGEFIGENDEDSGYPFDTLEIHTASGSVTENEPWGDVQRVEYYLADPMDEFDPDGEIVDRHGFDLVRSVVRNLLETEIEEPEEEILLNGIQSLDFTYYDGEYWQESWDSTTQEDPMPVAVKAYIEFVEPENDDGVKQKPIEIVCELVMEPKQTESQSTGVSSTGGGSTGGGGQPGGGER